MVIKAQTMTEVKIMVDNGDGSFSTYRSVGYDFTIDEMFDSLIKCTAMGRPVVYKEGSVTPV